MVAVAVMSCEKEEEKHDPPGNGNNNQKDSTITDIEGNHYPVIEMGEQKWLTKNLQATSYNDGTPINHVRDEQEWSNLANGAYSWYHNDTAHAATYGALYNWYATASGKLCPKGWRVANDDDWKKLKDFLTNRGHVCTEGNALKNKDAWEFGADDYGFNALPAGRRDQNGQFHAENDGAYWWTQTEFDKQQAWYWYVFHYSGQMIRHYNPKNIGLSVRCIK